MCTSTHEFSSCSGTMSLNHLGKKKSPVDLFSQPIHSLMTKTDMWPKDQCKKNKVEKKRNSPNTKKKNPPYVTLYLSPCTARKAVELATQAGCLKKKTENTSNETSGGQQIELPPNLATQYSLVLEI